MVLTRKLVLEKEKKDKSIFSYFKKVFEEMKEELED